MVVLGFDGIAWSLPANVPGRIEAWSFSGFVESLAWSLPARAGPHWKGSSCASSRQGEAPGRTYAPSGITRRQVDRKHDVHQHVQSDTGESLKKGLTSP